MSRMIVCCCCLLLTLFLECQVTEAYAPGECNLKASDLGPDWYKVPQPVPEESEGAGYEPSYVHMPCAPTTMFEISVCGCTNLVSLIFTSMQGKPDKRNTEERRKLIEPGDFVKALDPKIEERNTAGNVVLNTRTGEMTNCPFRASSRGQDWYLAWEPGDVWRHMRCADGTLFSKIKCTCEHRSVALREPIKPEDENLVIIAEDSINTQDMNTISRSLGINLNDVDFGFNKNKDDGDIPFWRRSNPTNTQPEVIRPRNILSDVSVNIHHQNQLLGTNRRSEVNIGMDQISDAHKELLIRLRSGPRSFLPTEKTSSILILDRIEQKPNALPRNTGAVLNEAPVNVDWKVDANIPNTRKPFIYVEPKPLERTKVDHESKEMREMQTFFNEFKEVHKERNETGNSVPQPKQIVYQPIVEIVKHVSDDVNIDVLADVLGVIGNQINAIENTKVPVERIVDNVNVQPIVFDMGADSVDVVTGAECRKKPVLDLGDQYFLLPVLGVGYIPYACHGDQVYDHFICGCRKATSGEVAYNEMLFPSHECNKRAIPELGPKFFQTFSAGLGYVPIACHGDTGFDVDKCTCV